MNLKEQLIEKMEAEFEHFHSWLLEQPPEEQLALEPGQIPYTDNWRIEDIPIEEPFRQGSQN